MVLRLSSHRIIPSEHANYHRKRFFPAGIINSSMRFNSTYLCQM